MSPKPQPGILDIAPYVGGDSHVAGVQDILKLSSNENPWGPPAAAVQAMQDAAVSMHRYPSTDHAALRQAIAKVHGLDADNIICGVGSDEIITFLCQAYAGPGDEVIYTEHGFAMYKISALAASATSVMVSETDRHVDVDKILAGVTDRTRLVFLANPANPTATFIPMEDITRLADGLPDHVVLVLDGAYAEFAPGYDGGASLVAQRSNVVMTRTFSKLYGLGGLRVGWAYAPSDMIDVMNRIRGPFNLSAPALAAAEAAIDDESFANDMIAKNAAARTALQSGLAALGVHSGASFANFILADFESQTQAEACCDHLKSSGIITRKVAGYHLPNSLRITVPKADDVPRVVDAVAAFLKGAQ
ncbi:MAG: histidinol-phosphate transaminase [Planktomarina sp.]